MNITNFAKKLAEKPVFKTRIKSDQVKLPEIAIGYFLAPFCAMFANAIFGAYLNRYYVDVLGWTKFGAFATLLPIVSVIFVVLGNLMIGQWIDNTGSTQGKARPYMIIAAPMLIIAIILMFMTPAKGNNAVQMIWIAVSYNLYYALAYPCFYCAHSSMVSLSTRNSESRGLLATLSNAAMVASAGVGASIVVPILLQSFLFVTKDGGIDVDASYSHWRIISIVLCLVSAFGCMLEYYFTRERITEETINLNVKEEKMPLKKQLEGCIHNKYWWIIILYFLIFQFGQLVKNSSMSFYVRWMFDSVINSANPEQTSGALMSTLGLVGGIPTAVGMVVAWPIARKLGKKRAVVTEGAAYFPHIMKKLHVPEEQYAAITPTKDFQISHYKEREWVPYILEGCSDKEKAFQNWMGRDSLFADTVCKECMELNYLSIINDGGNSIDEMVQIVSAHFGLKV